jgi:hypothetical protein
VAKAQAGLLRAEAKLRTWEAEVCLVESDLAYEKYRLHCRRLGKAKRGGDLWGLAVVQRCLEEAKRASSRSILALQEAGALTVQGELRAAVAGALAASAQAIAGLKGITRKADAMPHLEAAMAACQAVLAPLDRADGTIGVPSDFLQVQATDMEQVCQEICGQIKALRTLDPA